MQNAGLDEAQTGIKIVTTVKKWDDEAFRKLENELLAADFGFSNTTVQKHQFFGTQPSSQSNSHIHT